MYTINLNITPLAVAVFEGIQGTLGRLNSTDTQTQTGEMAAITTPVLSPVQPTKGAKLESKLDLGVIEEDDEEDEEDMELVVNALGTSELPAVTISTGSLPAKEFQFGHLHGCLANPMEPIPELTLPPTSHSFVPEMNTDTEGHADQFRGTVPPSSLEIAVMKHRLKRAPYVSSMLNPDSVRAFSPLVKPRATKNMVYLTALSNYTLQQAVKAVEAAKARAEAAGVQVGAMGDDDEQFLLLPPGDYDDLFAEYIDFDAIADDFAERQANAHTWDDMEDDDYY